MPASVCRITKRLTEKNLAANAVLPEVRGYIRSQRDAPIRAFRYGLASMAYNGCEVIAAYHARLSLGAPLPLHAVAAELSALPRALWLWGIFGTRPGALPRYFARAGFGVRRYSRHTREIAEKVFIYSFWNPRFRGIHTVEAHETAHGYTVCNYPPLDGCFFPSSAALLAAIPTPYPICLSGISLPT